MTNELFESLEPLALADPELALSVAERLARQPGTIEAWPIKRLITDTIWALGVEASFGRAVALGYAELIADAPAERIAIFHRWLRKVGEKGPTLGRIAAECLPPVLRHGDAETLGRFEQAWKALAAIGTHALGEPLRGLGFLLAGEGRAAAHYYFDLLHTLFAADPSQEEVRYFSNALPTAIRQLAPPRRDWQLKELLGIARRDRRLVEPFLSGLNRGLGRLGEKALQVLVTEAMDLHSGEGSQAARWLALESQTARQRFSALQVSIGFAEVQDRLRRYLHARTGLSLAIRPLSALPGSGQPALGPGRRVCSDAQAIYLPDEIEDFDDPDQNAALYRLLLRLEASFHEFGTFDFDGEKAWAACRCFIDAGFPIGGEPPAGRSELETFLHLFPDPRLAGELFAIVELGRIRKCLERAYGGLVRRYYPLLRDAFRSAGPEGSNSEKILPRLAARLALGIRVPGAGDAVVEEMAAAFEAGLSADSPVEASAGLAARFFAPVRGRLVGEEDGAPFFTAPFGWRPWPNPASAERGLPDRMVEEIRAALALDGLTAYRSDIRRRLRAGAGDLTPEDIRALCRDRPAAAGRLEAILSEERSARLAGLEEALPEEGPVFRYPEWDDRLGDYLPEHVRLRERIPPEGAIDHYADVLRRHYGLVRQTRKAFERLRPEGLKRLRGWLDGDEFDYRRLIEAAVDRRIGGLPPDRLFVKRVKDRREVAVLLLVDLSRSTAHSVPGSEASVLEIEKDAIVILCEALTILGDALAVAGFSGSGRLGVDYFRIKDFDEPLSEEVKRRVGGLQPQRNTRMGAAIRHAARELAARSALVRLLMILSDGFPNDTGYGIRFHALTVNLPADPQLDQLYGKARHHLVSDVRELPGRLLRVYSALTR